jgi:hypothetical protein
VHEVERVGAGICDERALGSDSTPYGLALDGAVVSWVWVSAHA